MLLTAPTGQDEPKAQACQVPRAGQLHQLGQKLPCDKVARESTSDCITINLSTADIKLGSSTSDASPAVSALSLEPASCSNT